ncbi:outer membrane lipid asymmetry maintenance protein MlaD [Xinfangfangia sp. D13-10-4-6]|uniref:outer membrane lipid asymmetry maintenance protein MlaD n=1 Tax=Pseudogemmobacter hezensis TaxID=2737662 RepID=UPI0015519292|nr:outer membrane lipid asymmetry maintenance protein MlaD [Pseudogemmobacter hezensis]NPD15804.1 outer membrane lipid asymmetry maintenance protein MlaD [Pseudogemmobacter hezensis]
MSRSVAEVLTGAAVLAVGIGFAVWAAGSAGRGFGAGASYPLVASFRAVDGIQVGSDVRLAGLKVGTITALTLNPKTFFADATISMQQGIELPVDTAILISQDGLLGGNYVELRPGGMDEVLAPGDEIEDTQGSVSLLSLLMKFVGGGSDSAASSGTDGG